MVEKANYVGKKYYSKYSELTVHTGKSKNIKFSNHIYVSKDVNEEKLLEKTSAAKFYTEHLKDIAGDKNLVTKEEHTAAKTEIAKLKAELAAAKK